MKKVLKWIGIAFVVFGIVIAAIVFLAIKQQTQELDKLQFSEIDISTIADGTYQGRSETTFVKAEVSVTVANGKILAVQIVNHENGLGSNAESIVKEMVTSNTYDVDAVSGASISSKVIKSAVYNALITAPTK